MLKQSRSLVLFILLNGVTFGIFAIFFWQGLNNDLNKVQRKYNKKQMPYICAWLLGFVTFGIIPLIWFIKLTMRLYEQTDLDKIRKHGSLEMNFIFKYLLFFTIVCPFIALYWDIKNSNEICQNYNRQFFKDIKQVC